MSNESRALEAKGRLKASCLYSAEGKRKYINADERRRFIEAARQESPEVFAFCMVLVFLGLRVSEALALRADDIQFEEGIVAVRCLKKRGAVVVRELPAAPVLLAALKPVCGPAGGIPGRLWPWSRVSAWRTVKDVLAASHVVGGQAMPKGFRHGFGVHAVRSGVPLDLVQRWLGHADIATTAIYTHVTGPEEQAIAARMW